MRKLFIVLSLCGALIAGALVAPTVYRAAQLRLTMWRMPGLILTEAQSQAFAQLIIDFITQMLAQGAFGGSAQTRKGEWEKFLAAAKESATAKLNQQATNAVTKAFAGAQADFTPNNVERACRISRESQETQSAALSAHIEKKSVAIAEGMEHNSGKPEAEVAKAVLQNHNDKYCTQEGVDRQRCTTVSNTPDADVMASTLLAGDGSETFTKEQYEAARAFMRTVTDPVPPENLPKGMENTPAGQRYLLERRVHSALISMSQEGFARILAARAPSTP